MHIRSSPLNNQLAFSPTESAQQTMAARKAAAEVRRKLTSFTYSEEEDAVSRVDARSEADPNRRRSPQHDDEPFRSVFFSASA